MDLKELKIGKHVAELPIIQGGMSIRTSLAPLASAVSNAGGIGVIGCSAVPTAEVVQEIKKCRSMTSGIVAVNIMYMNTKFSELIRESIKAGVDIIFTGAGFSKEIYKTVKGTGVAVASVVSSVKAGKLAEKLGADAIVVEGSEKGGHVCTDVPLDILFPEVRAAINSIPVIAAGGIIDGYDIAKYLKMGAAGVQLGSRFLCSDECSASLRTKLAYLNATKENIIMTKSPLGFPARAIKNRLTEQLQEGKAAFHGCKFNCINRCNKLYCIYDRIELAMNGDVENGLLFFGANAWKIQEVLPAAKIIEQLVQEISSIKENQEAAKEWFKELVYQK